MNEIKNDTNVINIDIVSIIKEAKSEEKSKIATFIAGEYRLAKNYISRNELDDATRNFYFGMKEAFGYLLYQLNPKLLDKVDHRERRNNEKPNKL